MSGTEDNDFQSRPDGEPSSSPDGASSASTASGNDTIGRQTTQYQHQYPGPNQTSVNQYVNGSQGQHHVHQAANYHLPNSTYQMPGQQVPHAQQGSQGYGAGTVQNVAVPPAVPQQPAVTTNPGDNGAPAPRRFKYAMMPDGWQPDRTLEPDLRIVDRRPDVPKMEDEGRQSVQREPVSVTPQPRQISTRINHGLRSGMFWFGFFDANRLNVPVTKCSIRVARGRGSEGRGSTHAWPNQPRSTEPIPANVSLSEICRDYPNHVWGDMLRLFISEGWDARRIYDNFPAEVRQECEKDADSKKSHSGRPHNFLQAAIGREIDVMANEDHIYRRIVPNPAKGHKRTRPSPGDSNQPTSTDGGDDTDDDENTSVKRQRSETPYGSQRSGRSASDSRVQPSSAGPSVAGFGPLPGLQAIPPRASQSLSPSGHMQPLHPPQPWMNRPAPAGRTLHDTVSRHFDRHVRPDLRNPANYAGHGLTNYSAQGLSQQQSGPFFPRVPNTQYQQSAGFNPMAGGSGHGAIGGVQPIPSVAMRRSISDQFNAQYDPQIRRQLTNDGVPLPRFLPQRPTLARDPRSTNNGSQMHMPGSATPDQQDDEDDKDSFENFRL